jgi:hypothetical protein
MEETMAKRATRTLTLTLIALALAGMAGAQPVFTKVFIPSTIGPGNVSTLTFTITNNDVSNVSSMAFTDNLPAGMTIATPANSTSTCSGTLSAPDGGTAITFSDGELEPGPGAVCTISVNITSSTGGLSTNTSGDLTSSAGNSGPATAGLTVDNGLPGFSKSFSPATVSLGGRSTLTFTFDNSANASAVGSLDFTDNLPTGMVIASPSNATTDCISVSAPNTTIIASAGSSVITLDANGSTFFPGFEVLPVGATCTVTVDVMTTGVGQLGNVTNQALADFVMAGVASAILDVTVTPLALIKSFVDNPIPSGGTGTLEFTITNYDRFNSATGISFTDDLNAALPGLQAIGLPLNDICGAGSQISGTTNLSFTGGTLAPSASCTFSVDIQVPAGAVTGAYTNTTSAISGTAGGSPVDGNQASETLFVSPTPLLTKAFITDPSATPAYFHPVAAGSTTGIEFTITNTSTTSTATDIAFIDELTTFMPFPLPVALPAPGFCGGATMGFVFPDVDRQALSMTGGSLAAGDSCTFVVELHIPAGFPAGNYLNTTSEITAIIDAAIATGDPASATMQVIGAPHLSKQFTDDPVQPGGTMTLEFTLSHDALAIADTTAITFTDNLAANPVALQATGLPLTDICGVGSQISGTTNLSFTGGTLAPGASCTFSVTLQVPGAGPSGSFPNTTSNVVATSAGATVTGYSASDTFVVTGLTFSKAFTNDPVVPGGTATLEFTLDNTVSPDPTTAITFFDDLNSVLIGLVPTGLPLTDPCGAGSQLQAAGAFLTFTGGNLPAGGSCSFSVDITVPGAAADGVYSNSTSTLSATVGSPPAVASLPVAFDTLTVNSSLLNLTKTFTDDPVVPGGNVTMELTLSNLHPTETATAIGFTDDLDAALTGLTIIGLPATGFCGASSLAAGTSVLTITGAELAGGASCTFSFTLQVPAVAPSVVTNTTSTVSGTIAGLPITGPAASDDLVVNNLIFSKSFNSSTFPGQTVDLALTIDNIGTTDASPLQLTDDLDAVILGLVATGLPRNDICGAGSQLSGTSILALNNANLLPGGSCTIIVTLQVPAGATAGSYLNTTSDLLLGGSPASPPATATLVIETPPAFSKAFTPATVSQGGISTLTLTIDNTASTATVTALDFTDNLPAGMVLATPANASTTCTGGTLTAVDGSGTIAYTGGTVAAGTSCTVVADVVGNAAGSLVNTTGNLTSSAGDSGTATATLQVTGAPLPTLGLNFDPTMAEAGIPIRATMTIDNSASTVAATGLQVALNLPAGLEVANPANAVTTCTGGTLTATSGTALIDYSGGTVAAGATCTVEADIVGTADGIYDVSTGDLTSSLGNSGTATATVQIGAQMLIPTLSSLGMVLLSCLIALIAIFMLRNTIKP